MYAAARAVILALAISILPTNIPAPEDDVPEDVAAICEKYGTEYNIAPELLEAICWNESRFTASAENNTCKGIMQINISSHQARMEKLGVTDIWDIDSNIHVGADFLSELFETYEDVGVVLGSYHGEKNAVSKAQKGQLSAYTKRILKRAAYYERLHGK